jgi:hypothetical protein
LQAVIAATVIVAPAIPAAAAIARGGKTGNQQQGQQNKFHGGTS